MNIKERENIKKIENKNPKNKKQKENSYFFNIFKQKIDEIKKIEKNIQKKIKEKEIIIIEIFEINGILKLRKSEADFIKEIFSKEIVVNENPKKEINKKAKSKKTEHSKKIKNDENSFDFSLENVNKKIKDFLQKFKTSGKLKTFEKNLLNSETIEKNIEEKENKIDVNESKNKDIFKNLEKRYRELNLEIKKEMREIVNILEGIKENLK